MTTTTIEGAEFKVTIEGKTLTLLQPDNHGVKATFKRLDHAELAFMGLDVCDSYWMARAFLKADWDADQTD
jgi:hypothetical protein